MELIRYRPCDAIRWLQTRAQKDRREARALGMTTLIQPEDFRGIGANMKAAAGALFSVGRGAVTEIIHKSASENEYVLSDDSFEIHRTGSVKSVRYADVKSITLGTEKTIFQLERSQVVVKPYAYITAGRARAPLGWLRNGIEVPYDVLVDELAARCGIDPS